MTYFKDKNILAKGSSHLAEILKKVLATEDQIDQEKEHYYVIHLDIRSRIKVIELVSIGILNSAVVHPRETFRRAIFEGSASIIIAHNHPSGEVDPSDEDSKMTKNMFEAGNILGITMLDHIIFSHKNDQFFSFRDNEVKIR